MIVMTGMKIGYARVSTNDQDLTAQRNALLALGVEEKQIFVDHGLTGATVCGLGFAKRWRRAGLAIPSWSQSSTGWRALLLMPEI